MLERHGQRLGARLSTNGVELVLFPSVRDPGRGTTVAVLSPRAFARTEPQPESFQTWRCLLQPTLVSFHRLPPEPRAVAFPLATFLVDGRLPDLA